MLNTLRRERAMIITRLHQIDTRRKLWVLRDRLRGVYNEVIFKEHIFKDTAYSLDDFMFEKVFHGENEHFNMKRKRVENTLEHYFYAPSDNVGRIELPPPISTPTPTPRLSRSTSSQAIKREELKNLFRHDIISKVKWYVGRVQNIPTYMPENLIFYVNKDNECIMINPDRDRCVVVGKLVDEKDKEYFLECSQEVESKFIAMGDEGKKSWKEWYDTYYNNSER